MPERQSDASRESNSGILRQVFVDRARPGDGLCSFADRSPRSTRSTGRAQREPSRSLRQTQLKARLATVPTADGRVRLAGASQPGQSTEARSGERSNYAATTGNRRATTSLGLRPAVLACDVSSE